MKRWLFLLLPLWLSGQSPEVVDSLERVIKSNRKVTEKAVAYGRLIGYYQAVDREKAAQLISELDVYRTEECPECKILVHYRRGVNESQLNRFDKAVIHFKTSADIAEKYNFMKRVHFAKTQLIQMRILQRDPQGAESDIKTYLSNERYTKDNDQIHEVYFLWGRVNYDRGFLNTAIEKYLQAEEILFRTNGKNIFHVGNLNNIAKTYRQLKDYDKAADYARKALEYAVKSGDLLSENEVKLHQGIIECERGNPKIAVAFLKDALAFFEPFHADHCGSALLYLGIAYHALTEYDASLQYLAKAKNHYSNIDDKLSLAEVCGYMTRNLVAVGKPAQAAEYVHITQQAVKEFDDAPQIIDILTSEIQYHEALGDYRNAMLAIKKQTRLRQAAEQKMSKTTAMEIEAKYENAFQKDQIRTLSLEKTAADTEKKTQRYIFIGIVTLLILAGITAYFLYRNKIRTAQRLQEVSEMKSRFFANISHEFRTPLTLIKSPVQQLKESGIDPEQKKQAELIDRNADRMLELVNQLIELSKLDGGHLKLILKKGNPTDFLASIAEPFEFDAENRGLNFKSAIPKVDTTHEFDRDVLEKITANLLSNAFRYHASSEPITLDARVEDQKLTLCVSNTTNDLKKDDVSKIFERFYKKNNAANSSGIGLALVKELVDLYQGSIDTNLEGDRLTFLVSLPMPQVSAEDESVETLHTAEIPDEKPVLLIVDDNADIRSVVKSVFTDHYTVIEAVDGIDALEIARREIPDAIVSDVMMPKMDGFEFATKIKADELTSFIPVVMLTARTSDEAHLEALQHSADAFLTKPFNHEILRSTVANLLAERRMLQERYSRELVLRPVDIAVSSADEKFVLKLQTVLDLHITNSNLSAEDFASAIGMSRMQLHRKLKSLLGVSTTEFLRNERLNAAAKLLEKGNLQVSDVAYSVGFNDLSYFSKCFRERFGCTPSEYMNGNL